MRILLPVLALLGGVGSAHAHRSLHFVRDGQVALVPYQKLMDVKEMTLEVWIKVEPNANFYSYIISRNYGDLGYGLALHGRPDKVFSQAPEAKVPMGRWVHLAVVVSTKARKVYVDGELAAASEHVGNLRPYEFPLMIGDSNFVGLPGGEPTTFRGSIDELRIWSKPRTQAQVRQTMNRYLRGNERGLVAYFPFEEGKGQIVHDYTGHLISGSLGKSFQPHNDDPDWVEGVKLKGSKPRLRTRR